MVSVAIARNGRERRIKTFFFWTNDCEKLWEKAVLKGVPMVFSWITEQDARILKHTKTYPKHAA